MNFCLLWIKTCLTKNLNKYQYENNLGKEIVHVHYYVINRLFKKSRKTANKITNNLTNQHQPLNFSMTLLPRRLFIFNLTIHRVPNVIVWIRQIFIGCHHCQDNPRVLSGTGSGHSSRKCQCCIAVIAISEIYFKMIILSLFLNIALSLHLLRRLVWLLENHSSYYTLFTLMPF